MPCSDVYKYCPYAMPPKNDRVLGSNTSLKRLPSMFMESYGPACSMQLKRQRKLTDCWSANGKILVKDNSNRIVEIRNLDMLQKYN